MSPSAMSPSAQVVVELATKVAQAKTASDAISAAYRDLEESFIDRNLKSKAIYDEAIRSMPGGNTRTVLHYPPFPLSMTRAEGCKLYDADGHEYIDLLGEYTAGLYGHSHPTIMSAISAALSNGISFGSHHADEFKLAELIRARFPSMELLRFTNSGTEANLMAVAAAKIFTGRKKIVVFEGGYHGGVFVFGAGHCDVNVPYEFLLARYNDIASVKKFFIDHGSNIAAVLVEPMLGSGGGICGTRDFLTSLRDLTEKNGSLLIFDEVMTSRLYDGSGIQGEFGIKPDLTTLGKYIGGGMSFGAFGGRADIMALFDPRTGKIPHAGTFNNNVLTMAAGRAGLTDVFTPTVARALHQRGDMLKERLNSIAPQSKLKVMGCGSILVFLFTDTLITNVTCPGDVVNGNKQLGDLLHLFLLERGFYIARRGFIALSLVVDPRELDHLVEVVAEFVFKYKDLLQ